MYVCMYTYIYIYIYIYLHTYIHTSTYIYTYIYYYTPLPLNLANKQQASNNNTSPCCFGHCSVPTLRIFCSCSHLGASVMALPKPSSEPRTQRWRPGAVAPSWEVPSVNSAFWAKNSHFLPRTALVRLQNSQTKANGCYTPRAT